MTPSEFHAAESLQCTAVTSSRALSNKEDFVSLLTLGESFEESFELWPMALRPGILLLIQLALFIYTVKSCNVSCTTDFETLLNCSCTGLEPPEPLLLQVLCRFDDLPLNSSCLVSPQQPYCVMYPDIMEEISDFETVCRATALRVQDHTMVSEDSSDWLLRNAVRPWPPFNIHVKDTNGSHIISWDNKNQRFHLTFRVRIRPSPSTQEPEAILESTEPFFRLEQSRLFPGVCYTIDVQAMLPPDSRHQGPQSYWSTTASWTTAAPTDRPQVAETNLYYWLFTLPILMVLLSLGLTKMMFWRKKLPLVTHIPNPSEFFKPLYSIYEGNFKAWVMPAFTEHDFLNMDSVVDMRLDQWNQHFFLQTPPPPYNPSQSHSTFHSLSQSRGSSHVSIHTVTLSGEDHLSHCSVSSDYPAEAGCEPCVLGRDPEKRLHLNLSNLNLGQELDEEELSGDGYPLLDLDTIDSGFGECSSPPGSGPSAELLCQHYGTDSVPGAEQLCELYQSNYVKQWTISHCQGDSDRG